MNNCLLIHHSCYNDPFIVECLSLAMLSLWSRSVSLLAYLLLFFCKCVLSYDTHASIFFYTDVIKIVEHLKLGLEISLKWIILYIIHILTQYLLVCFYLPNIITPDFAFNRPPTLFKVHMKRSSVQIQIQTGIN